MYIFPTHLFRPSQIKADPVPRVISGGTALSGEETVISTDGGGRWEITYSGITLRTPQQLKLWDAWTSYMGGGAVAFFVPIVSMTTAPRPMVGGKPVRPPAFSGNDPYFPTVVSFATPYIVAETVGASLLRATTITIDVTTGTPIQGGEKFSIMGRAHKIVRVLSRAGSQATCLIHPPTRAAIPDGTLVVFDWPNVISRLAPGQDLSPSVLFGRRAEMSISFVEDFSGMSA